MGTDHFIKPKKEMGCPCLDAIPATITLAEAPISVAFPPKQAPRERAHHTGIMASRPPREASMDLSIGIMVATKGMLSIAPETMAETQIMSKLALLIEPSVNSINLCPSMARIPVTSSP